MQHYRLGATVKKTAVQKRAQKVPENNNLNKSQQYTLAPMKANCKDIDTSSRGGIIAMDG